MQAGPTGRVFKRSIAAIAEQPASGAGIRFGRAVGLGPAIQAAIDVRVRRPADVVRHQKVEVTVAIVVEPQGRSAQALIAFEPCLLRDFGKSAIAVVVKQAALPVAGNVQVGKAIVVVIAHRHPDAVHLEIESGGVRHVRERPVAVVAVKLHRRALPFVPRPVHSVYQQDVQPAVIVIIEEGAARAQRFRQVFLSECAAIMLEANTCVAGYVRELDGKLPLGRDVGGTDRCGFPSERGRRVQFVEECAGAARCPGAHQELDQIPAIHRCNPTLAQGRIGGQHEGHGEHGRTPQMSPA